jgi:hypothetical protein
MPLTFIESDDRIIKISVSGKLSKQDYEQFLPATERLIKEHGKVKVLVVMKDFHGWTAGGLWEDIKFDLRHFSDVDRVAMVGDRTWEKWMTWFCKPFTTASIRYFDLSNLDQARVWIEEENSAAEEDQKEASQAHFFQA